MWHLFRNSNIWSICIYILFVVSCRLYNLVTPVLKWHLMYLTDILIFFACVYICLTFSITCYCFLKILISLQIQIFFVHFPIKIEILYVIMWFIYDLTRGRYNIFNNFTTLSWLHHSRPNHCKISFKPKAARKYFLDKWFFFYRFVINSKIWKIVHW